MLVKGNADRFAKFVASMHVQLIENLLKLFLVSVARMNLTNYLISVV
jgi:hypothetical protein